MMEREEVVEGVLSAALDMLQGEQRDIGHRSQLYRDSASELTGLGLRVHRTGSSVPLTILLITFPSTFYLIKPN